MICAGDTKAGTLIAKDKYGNKYYENLEDELPCEKLQLPFWNDILNGYSANTMGRLQGRRVRSVRPPSDEMDRKALDLTLGYRSHIEPGWHAWISYMVDKPPTQDPILRTGVRPWELPDHRPNFTASRGAFKTYST
jgi:NADH:ubiquinone oxidoreductase subunit